MIFWVITIICGILLISSIRSYSQYQKALEKQKVSVCPPHKWVNSKLPGQEDSLFCEKCGILPGKFLHVDLEEYKRQL